MLKTGGAIIWTVATAKELWHFEDNTLSCAFCGTCHLMNAVTLMETIGALVDWFQVVKKVSEQNLNEEELAVFQAFIIFDASMYIICETNAEK